MTSEPVQFGQSGSQELQQEPRGAGFQTVQRDEAGELQALHEQSESIVALIRAARQLDRDGKLKSARHKLIEARRRVAELSGERLSKSAADREMQAARVRVRKAANKAEEKLRRLVSCARLYDWTDPDRCLRQLRARHLGDNDLAALPLTDIEEGLKDKGNVLWIVAVYPALREAIRSRLLLAKQTGRG